MMTADVKDMSNTVKGRKPGQQRVGKSHTVKGRKPGQQRVGKSHTVKGRKPGQQRVGKSNYHGNESRVTTVSCSV